MNKNYYDVPTQVLFMDEELGELHAGIAFRDVIICGCCGGIFELNDKENVSIIKDLCWVNIDDAIK